MSTSTRTIAVVGAGVTGAPIVRAVLSSPTSAKVIILTRPRSVGKSLPDDLSSVPTVPVDYTNVDAVAKVFKKYSVDVVVSTLPPDEVLKAQCSLADAAKASGTVKLFVPSEFGLPTEGAKAKGESNLFSAKDEFAEYLKTIQLPYTRIYTGSFYGSLPWMAGLDVNGKVNVLGKGETQFSATSEADIGGFTGHILTTLPLDSPHLVNQSLRLEGSRLSYVDLARIYEKPVAYVPDGELIPGKTEEERQNKTIIQIEAETGRGSTGWNRSTDKEEGTAGSSNHLWEGHVWDKVKKID